jgi:hypothetical protein
MFLEQIMAECIWIHPLHNSWRKSWVCVRRRDGDRLPRKVRRRPGEIAPGGSAGGPQGVRTGLSSNRIGGSLWVNPLI